MFWKKGKDNKPADEFDISFDLDRRFFYRVAPAPGKPIYFQLGASRFRVVDISAGGFSFLALGFIVDQRLTGVIHLPADDSPVPLILKVSKIIRGKLVAGETEGIKESDRERIHQYVLKRQKQEMERQRSQKPGQG